MPSAPEFSAQMAEMFHKHYHHTFAAHGPGPRGVDWRDASTADARYQAMLGIIEKNILSPSLLDVGAGCGGLLGYAKTHSILLQYTGVDMVAEMVQAGKRLHPEATFARGDFLALPFKPQSIDYVVCNGILTQKLTASAREMDDFAQLLLCRMFEVARRGIAFNVMSSHVNFMVDNLYYRNPAEMLAWCQTEFSPKAVLDHAYMPYEYTLRVYRDDP